LNAPSTDHSAVQVVLDRIREEGTKYVVSVSHSVGVAQSGYAFAKRAQFFCAALEEKESYEIISDSITDMKKIAQEAYTAAKSTADMFRANLYAFTEVW
jgi:hypothetical protein